MTLLDTRFLLRGDENILHFSGGNAQSCDYTKTR